MILNVCCILVWMSLEKKSDDRDNKFLEGILMNLAMIISLWGGFNALEYSMVKNRLETIEKKKGVFEAVTKAQINVNNFDSWYHNVPFYGAKRASQEYLDSKDRDSL